MYTKFYFIDTNYIFIFHLIIYMVFLMNIILIFEINNYMHLLRQNHQIKENHLIIFFQLHLLHSNIILAFIIYILKHKIQKNILHNHWLDNNSNNII